MQCKLNAQEKLHDAKRFGSIVGPQMSYITVVITKMQNRILPGYVSRS